MKESVKDSASCHSVLATKIRHGCCFSSFTRTLTPILSAPIISGILIYYHYNCFYKTKETLWMNWD